MKIVIWLFSAIIIYQFENNFADDIQSCRRFSRIAVGKKPSQDPYEIVDILVKDDARCFSVCSHSKQCRSFLVEDNHPVFKCHFYNVTIHLLTLVPGESSMTFHSVHYLIFRDCVDWYNAGARETGVYQITLPAGPKQVRCNMEVDGGGWLVFQHRFNGTVDFDKGWQNYKIGIGSVDGEFWLGNDLLHYLTTAQESELYIHAGRFNGNFNFSKYSPFRVESEENLYRLNIPTLVDGIHSMRANNLQYFTTGDNDNDKIINNNCAKLSYPYGGFWFQACSAFYPNAKYKHQEPCVNKEGIIWHTWLDKEKSLKWTEMMFRRTDGKCY